MIRSDWPLRRIGKLRKRDVLDAFKIVAYVIRTKCQRFAAAGLTQAEACELALRIREQRELVRQMVEPRNSKHARRLLRLNGLYRRDLVRLVDQAGLDAKILVFK